MFELGFRKVPGLLGRTDVRRMRNVMSPLCDNARAENGMADTKSLDLTNPYHEELLHIAADCAAGVTDTPRDDLRFLGGAIIPKYPGEPRRTWHVDWWNWENKADTERRIPPQVGVIFYLDMASALVGELQCLSRNYRYPGRLLGTQTELSAADDEYYPVPCYAGDAVVLDARTMHAVTANRTKRLRIACTLWFLVQWSQLSESTQAGAMPCADLSMSEALGSLQPNYTGNMKPPPHNPVPGYTE